MRNSATRKIWILAFLMAICVAGCGREQTVNPAPLLVSTLPANGATSVPVKQVVSATFNMAMNPTTINVSTFTMTGPGGTVVAGAVTYSGVAAQFTPAVPLLPATLYTATVTVGAQNVSGDALAANFVWSFTTAATPTVISTTSSERRHQRTPQPEDYRELQHSHESGDNFGFGNIYGSSGGCRRRGGAGNA